MWDLIHDRGKLPFIGPFFVNDSPLVAWQSTLPFSIDKIISHRREASFAVFHSMATGEASVRVSIFQASSSIPLSIHNLPFTLRNVEFNSSQAGVGFGFVAITHAWKIVLIGDSVPRSTDEGLSPKSISLNSQRQNRTLFQDIFGVSAFEEDLRVDQRTTSEAPSRKGVSHPLSDTPAFASPPLDTFFDTFLSSFLTVRELKDADKTEEENMAIEDDAMDQSENVEIIQQPRFHMPNPSELESFTALFRSTCHIAGGLWVAFLLYF